MCRQPRQAEDFWNIVLTILKKFVEFELFSQANAGAATDKYRNGTV